MEKENLKIEPLGAPTAVSGTLQYYIDADGQVSSFETTANDWVHEAMVAAEAQYNDDLLRAHIEHERLRKKLEEAFRWDMLRLCVAAGVIITGMTLGYYLAGWIG